VFSASDISLDEEISVEFEDKSFELEEVVVVACELEEPADMLDEDAVALEEDSFACELEEDVDALEEVVALEESPVLEEELLPEAFPLEEDDSISVSELSGSSCSAPVEELSLSPQAASNMAKKMQ
jgi:hypothetical protein